MVPTMSRASRARPITDNAGGGRQTGEPTSLTFPWSARAGRLDRMVIATAGD